MNTLSERLAKLSGNYTKAQEVILQAVRTMDASHAALGTELVNAYRAGRLIVKD